MREAQSIRPAGSIGTLRRIQDTFARALQQPLVLPAIAIVMVLVARALGSRGVDVAALLTWAEHMLDGARPSIDFTETNPPGSYLLYLPAAMLGRLLAMRSEIATEIIVLSLIALSLYLSWRALAPTSLLRDHNKPSLLAAAIVVLGVMPAITFAQREHIGLLLLLPLLAGTAACAEGDRPSGGLRLTFGIMAGLAFVAKPHLALIAAGALGTVVVLRRSLRPVLQVEWHAMAAVIVAYLAIVHWTIPEFYSISLPLLVDVYLPVTFDLYYVVVNPLLPISIMVSIVMLHCMRREDVQPVHVLLGVCSFLAIALYYLQAKGYPYHALPAMQLMLLALVWEATRRLSSIHEPRLRPLLVVALLLPAIAYSTWFHKDQSRDLKSIEAIINAHRSRPTMMAIALEISIGHPLVRMVEGKWVHSLTHLWSTHGVLWQIARGKPDEARKARLIGYARAEINGVVRTLEHSRPEVVLVQLQGEGHSDLDMLAWARTQPALALQLEAYSEIGRVGDVAVLARHKVSK